MKAKYQVLEDPEVEIELWQDEDTDPAKTDFVQETVTYEGTWANAHQ